MNNQPNNNTDRNRELPKGFKRFLPVILAAVILAAAVFTGLAIANHQRNVREAAANASLAEQTQDSSDYRLIAYNGKKYEYNSDIKTILFLGVDKTGEVVSQEYPGYGGQADTILLLLLNSSDQTANILEIPRDTMTDISIYDSNNQYYATQNAQITLQYAYGDGASRSNWLMKNTVSDLIYSLPIESVISLNMEGLDTVVDGIGGVTMTMDADYSYIDPSLTQGAAITMNGSLAERFTRYRDTNTSGSNLQRMSRQTLFIEAFLSQARKASLSGSAISSLLNTADPYLTTDMDAESIKALYSYSFNTNASVIPGEMTQGDVYDEYHVDRDALKDLIIQMYYKEANNQ